MVKRKVELSTTRMDGVFEQMRSTVLGLTGSLQLIPITAGSGGTVSYQNTAGHRLHPPEEDERELVRDEGERGIDCPAKGTHSGDDWHWFLCL